MTDTGETIMRVVGYVTAALVIMAFVVAFFSDSSSGGNDCDG